ncbi:hypothetical protein KXD93_21425 [Mucilaginibacter sp. BJC16-A38]|uniref:hypothetical protein n=1 Tax=Mucilaginibacter phenanthrenivorans TaxID=1234842 RepID=UPI0021571639|nr:hypothetical protein [Mucilaginibacter phenanthrenivorans]MCR8560227.1 hypothetical protein [Mucilaginibacter phenanthrenivorans]
MKQLSLKCPVCAHAFHHRVKRNWFLKHVLFFLPIKIYCCSECKKAVYMVVKDIEIAPSTSF